MVAAHISDFPQPSSNFEPADDEDYTAGTDKGDKGAEADGHPDVQVTVYLKDTDSALFGAGIRARNHSSRC